MSATNMIQDFIHELARQGKTSPRLIETHISWVILADGFAYKVKKPVKFAFVDFTTLDKRKHACLEELRLNRRLAPEVYLDVVPITRDGSQNTIEWAVKMRAFDAKATLDQLANISECQIDPIAEMVARFHAQEPSLDPHSPLGSKDQIKAIVTDNLKELTQLLPGNHVIEALASWTGRELERLSDVLASRKVAGMIKDCHGDLHLANIAWDGGKPLIFDCIEFSEKLRCIDVVNEVTFLFMDLHAHGHAGLAWRMLNRYLEITGDYDGIKVLRFYAVYRALVRAKISLHQSKNHDCERYLKLAERLSRPQAVELLLMHGYSGSGKTYWSQKILQERGMVRLRSDVERQRLFTDERYAAFATQKTFEYLQDLARALLQAGYCVIVDATFLKQPLRAMFIDMGTSLGISVWIVDVTASADECRARICQRLAEGRDASEADLQILEQQLGTSDPLSEAEQIFKIQPQLICSS